MNKKGEGVGYGISLVMVFLGIAFVLFIVLVYPSERAELLGDTSSSVSSISITSNGFSPSDLEINVGGRVTWVNRDTSKHTITFLDSQSNTMGPGGSYSKRFLETGSFTYTSDFNPGFKGTIKVT